MSGRQKEPNTTDYDMKLFKIYTLLFFIVVFGSGGGENDDLAMTTGKVILLFS